MSLVLHKYSRLQFTQLNEGEFILSYILKIYPICILSLALIGCAEGGKTTISRSEEILNECINDFLGSCVIKGADKGTIEPNLRAENIANGISIFGVTGTFTGSGGVGSLASNMHRDIATTQITAQTETVTNAGVQYANNDPGYRAIPRIGKDDDGYTGGSVTYVDRSTWSTTTCGTSQSTVALRIADCASVFGANATWDGSVKGNAGQSVWKLVTRTGDRTNSRGREVWRDERTGLLWSSLVSTGLNWCKATGSNNIAGNPAAETDPQGYCDKASYQNTSGLAISACFEDGGTYFTDADANIDNAGKAGLGRSSSPAVSWRLPTKYDQAQAEVNGIRFVLPEMGPNATNWEWSASVFSDYRYSASIFYPVSGNVSYADREYGTSVRCVGR